VRFSRPPFESYKYSGGGVMIMQLAVTDLVGRPFAAFVRDRVLEPLGMTSSSFEQPLPEALAARGARAHDAQGKRMDPSIPWHVYPEQAAAGLWTTASDLARFVIEVQMGLRGPRGRVLNQATAREMVSVHVGPYGVGLSLRKDGDGWYFNHSGATWGYKAWVYAHTRKGYGVVILTNSDNGTPLIDQLENRIAAAYGWDNHPRAVPAPR
jgi:CubicO group peptidase (beta-lactamase class C family)